MKKIVKINDNRIRQAILFKGLVMLNYWISDELVDRMVEQGWIRSDTPNSWDYITANDDGELVVLKIWTKEDQAIMKQFIAETPFNFINSDELVTAQMVYKGLLNADASKITKKQREAYNQLIWVVNLTDCTKAVEIIKAYLKEFEIFTAGVVKEVFGIDLNDCGIIYSDAY